MTVKELIAGLQTMNPDALVLVSEDGASGTYLSHVSDNFKALQAEDDDLVFDLYLLEQNDPKVFPCVTLFPTAEGEEEF